MSGRETRRLGFKGHVSPQAGEKVRNGAQNGSKLDRILVKMHESYGTEILRVRRKQ